jgi:hypothetical protein
LWATAPIIEALCRENAMLRQHAKSHQRDYDSLTKKLDAADREVLHLERVLALARGEK